MKAEKIILSLFMWLLLQPMCLAIIDYIITFPINVVVVITIIADLISSVTIDFIMSLFFYALCLLALPLLLSGSFIEELLRYTL